MVLDSNLAIFRGRWEQGTGLQMSLIIYESEILCNIYESPYDTLFIDVQEVVVSLVVQACNAGKLY